MHASSQGRVKFYEPGKGYGKLYNFDVLFEGMKGGAGMMLENDGTTTKYDANAHELSPEGTWFFVVQGAPM